MCTIVVATVCRVGRAILDRQPFDRLNEITHEARHEALEQARVTAQHKLVNHPRLVELLYNCNARENFLLSSLIYTSIDFLLLLLIRDRNCFGGRVYELLGYILVKRLDGII